MSRIYVRPMPDITVSRTGHGDEAAEPDHGVPAVLVAEHLVPLEDARHHHGGNRRQR